MRIRIHPNAASNYVHRCYRHARPDSPRLHRPEWEEKLRAVQGEWLTVETKHLFADQFNTAPIPGVSDQGLRIMLADIVEIEDDARVGIVKCWWCFGYDNDGDGHCDKCGRSEHLAPLKPLFPTPLAETA